MRCPKQGKHGNLDNISNISPNISNIPPNISNIPPISLLPAFSKVYKKILNNRLKSVLSKNNILCASQFGFISQKSTKNAIYNVQDHIYNSLNNNQVTTVIFFDLAKTFGILDHNLLLRKIEPHGIRDVVLDLFKAYLSNRCGIATVESKNLTRRKNVLAPSEIIGGVPQGSILGPILFLLYVNDMPRCLENCVTPYMHKL